MKEKISKFTLLLHSAKINPPSANTGETIDTKKHLWTVFNLKTPEKEKHRKFQNFYLCNSKNSKSFRHLQVSLNIDDDFAEMTMLQP